MTFSLRTKHQKPNLPYRFYYFFSLFLVLVGLLDTGYLAWLHYKNYTDITFASFCALTKNINCDTVSQSPWSILLGLPLAYWGFLAYLFFFVLLLFAGHTRPTSIKLWHLLCPLSAGYVLASLFFAYISATKIAAHCILCLVSHAITLFLFLFTIMVLTRFRIDPFFYGLKKSFFYVWNNNFFRICIFATIFSFIMIKSFLPEYWQFNPPKSTNHVKTGKTKEGHPWIGAENPKITIHEFTDYQCFQCSKMHLMLRNLIAANPGAIQLVHHHYPLDHEYNNIIVPEPFHVGSGKMAMIAIYAASKDGFWQMNDALYAAARSKQTLSTRKLAEQTNFTMFELASAAEHPEIRLTLLYDIRKGMKLHITGTPSYVIDGTVYQGMIPADILQKAVQ